MSLEQPGTLGEGNGDGPTVGKLHLPKEDRIGERAGDLAEQSWREVDRLAGAVAELEPQREVGYLLDVYHAVDLVSHDDVASCLPAAGG